MKTIQIRNWMLNPGLKGQCHEILFHESNPLIGPWLTGQEFVFFEDICVIKNSMLAITYTALSQLKNAAERNSAESNCTVFDATEYLK